MGKWLALTIAFLSSFAFAHDVQIVTQHIKLNRQHDSAWQMDAIGTAEVSKKWDFGLQATYLDRFHIYERRAGAFVAFKPTPTLTFEGRYLKGEEGVIILPHDFYNFTMYHALAQGISPYISYRNSLYSITHLQTLNFGVEIERFSRFVIIPQFLIGEAEFKHSDVKEVSNYGVKVIYFIRDYFSVSAFGFRGVEAAQGIVGQSARTVNTASGGAGVTYFFVPDLRSEFIFDYTDYGKLKNQFLTSTLNLIWTF